MAKKNTVSINVIGGNAEDVTGSASLITFDNLLILFEFGLIQKGKNIYENYCYNRELIGKVKASKIDYIIVGHTHADHIALIPALYAKGCTAKIIVPKGSYDIMKEMWLDCAYINQRDCDILTAQKEKVFYPFYTNEDVYAALENVIEVEMNNKYSVTDSFHLRFVPAGHILFSAQTELFFTKSNQTKKVLFTSDLGNLNLKNHKLFVEEFEPVINADIVIGEATYASAERTSSKKTLKKDMEKIKTIISQYCVDYKKRVLIPCFALDRLPYMMWILYSLFGTDENFNIPICIDSPLGIRLLRAYKNNIPADANMTFALSSAIAALLSSDSSINLKFFHFNIFEKSCCISSGMLLNGRNLYYPLIWIVLCSLAIVQQIHWHIKSRTSRIEVRCLSQARKLTIRQAYLSF